MSEAARKKYFWLKLKEDFFRNKKIKKLRKIAGGDTFTIIYLKMQLLSLRHEGKVFFEGVEDNLADEIALEIDEDPDNVKLTIAYLFSNNLIEEVDSNEFMLLEAVNCIGREGSSAERVRRHREKKKKQLPEPEGSEVKTLQCNAPVTNCNTEIETDKQKETEKEKEKEKETNKQTELSITEKDRVKLLSELFVGWSVSDNQILYLSSLVNERLPMEAGELYGRDIAIYDALFKLIKKAKAENVHSIYRWLEKVIPNWDF